MNEPNPDTLADHALLDTDELAAWIKIPYSTLTTWRSRNPERGPRWIKLEGSIVRYRVLDVRRWLAAQAQTTNGRQAGG